MKDRRFPHSAFSIPNSAFRIPHSAFRIPHHPPRQHWMKGGYSRSSLYGSPNLNDERKMDVRITSVVWEAVAQKVVAATQIVERTLGENLADEYGPELDLILVVVGISDDPEENARFARPHARVGRNVRWPDMEKRQYWSLPVEMTQADLEAETVQQLAVLISVAVSSAINSPLRQPPRSFDYETFRSDALRALELA